MTFSCSLCGREWVIEPTPRKPYPPSACCRYPLNPLSPRLSLGAAPCGVFYRFPAPNPRMMPCGRPEGHTGPHWAEPDAIDVADLFAARLVP